MGKVQSKSDAGSVDDNHPTLADFHNDEGKQIYSAQLDVWYLEGSDVSSRWKKIQIKVPMKDEKEREKTETAPLRTSFCGLPTEEMDQTKLARRGSCGFPTTLSRGFSFCQATDDCVFLISDEHTPIDVLTEADMAMQTAFSKKELKARARSQSKLLGARKADYFACTLPLKLPTVWDRIVVHVVTQNSGCEKALQAVSVINWNEFYCKQMAGHSDKVVIDHIEVVKPTVVSAHKAPPAPTNQHHAPDRVSSMKAKSKLQRSRSVLDCEKLVENHDISLTMLQHEDTEWYLESMMAKIPMQAFR
jgi:hypothetical protein